MTITGRILAIAIAALGCEPANATCVKPSREALVGQNFAGCCTLIIGPLAGARPELRWVAVNWEGPLDGKLYVVNCDGVKVAETGKLRYVERIDPAPRIGGFPTVAVVYIPTSGTGIKVRSVALVQYRGGQPRILWKHATLEATYPPPNLGQSYQDRTSWRFLQGNSRIEVSTVRTLLGRSLKALKVLKLPAERYCLRASAWRYVACK